MKSTFALLTGCFSGIVLAGSLADYSSPEKALQTLENAYIAKDIEAAVRSKAFYHEAENLLLSRFDRKVVDEALVEQTAKVLELSFRKEIQDKGFPDFKDIECTATSELLKSDLALLTETCRFVDGGMSVQQLKAYRVDKLWKVGELVE